MQWAEWEQTCCCHPEAGVSRWTRAHYCASSVPGDGPDISESNMRDGGTKSGSAQGKGAGDHRPGRTGLRQT